MNAWLLDAYQSKGKIILWFKTRDKDKRLELDHTPTIYIDTTAEPFLNLHKIIYKKTSKKTFTGKNKTVFEINVPNLVHFNKLIRFLEKGTKHRAALYNADITPELSYLFKNKLRPFSLVKVENTITTINTESTVPLRQFTIELKLSPDSRSFNPNAKITSITMNKKQKTASEKDLLKWFTKEFTKIDPDVIIMRYAYALLPLLEHKLKQYNLCCSFHRWDSKSITYRGGRSFFTYGQVRYRDYAIKLHGRFLLDSSTMVGSECSVEGIIELSQLTGATFQQVGSRSFGAIFQYAIMRKMFEQDLLVPYKEKPVDEPLTMLDFIKADRGALYLDPKTGFHKDVAQIDFSSMFPWIIYNYNISTESFYDLTPPLESVPGLPIKISTAKKGIVPLAIKPIIDRRMYYKDNPTQLNKERAIGLKWVLVTSYGYLRFREFKLGIASTHAAICAYAREILIQSMRLAESHGFEVVHGIVDSLFIKKKDLKEKEVRIFCKELENLTKIPVSFDGIFKWIVFLSGINETEHPIPARYFGAFYNGEIKARGIEVRQNSSPLIVRMFQRKILDAMAECDSREDIASLLPYCARLFHSFLASQEKEILICKLRVSKETYKHNLPQKIIIQKLKKKGITIFPGHMIKFIMTTTGPVPPEDYLNNLDKNHYAKLMVSSLYMVLKEFGISKCQINMALSQQTTLVPINSLQKISPISSDFS